MQQRNLLSGLFFGLLYIPFSLCLFVFLRDFLPDSSEDFHLSTQLFFFTVPYWAYIFWNTPSVGVYRVLLRWEDQRAKRIAKVAKHCTK